jgi:hypothetical protein
LFGKVISPLVRLMSTWKVDPPSVPPSLAPAGDDEPQPELGAPQASRSTGTASAHAIERSPLFFRFNMPPF